MKKRTSIVRFLCFASVIFLGDYGFCRFASAQEYPQTDWNYVSNTQPPSPQNPRYRLIRNRSALFYNVAKDGDTFPVKLADPSIAVVRRPNTSEDWFVMAGTGLDCLGNVNIEVYKSNNLVDWSYIGTVFDRSGESLQAARCFNGSVPCTCGQANCTQVQPATYVNTLTGVAGQTPYTSFWAPHVFVRPTDPSVLYVAFTATEYRALGPTDQPLVASCYWTSVSMDRVFAPLTTSSPICAACPPCPSPQTTLGATAVNQFVYSVNDAFPPTTVRYDGGASQGGNSVIATSGRYADQSTFDFSRGVWTHVNTTSGLRRHPKSWMGIDPYIFFDSSAASGAEPAWILYNGCDAATPGINQKTVWAYPILNQSPVGGSFSYVKATWSQGPLLMAESTDYSPVTVEVSPGGTGNNANVLLYNGQVDGAGLGNTAAQNRTGKSVAEGVSVFEYDVSNGARTDQKFIYVLISRNSWDSPSYGIFYRKLRRPSGTGNLADLALDKSTFLPANGSTEERALITADRRLRKNGMSFGHGEVFFVPDPNAGFPRRPYLVFHMKQDADTLYNDGNTGSNRRVYVKELRISYNSTNPNDPTNGDILQLGVAETDPRREPEVFLIPTTLPAPTTTLSHQAPLTLLFGPPMPNSGGTTTADVDDGTGTGTPDGDITVDDLLYYLMLYSRGQ